MTQKRNIVRITLGQPRKMVILMVTFHHRHWNLRCALKKYNLKLKK